MFYFLIVSQRMLSLEKYVYVLDAAVSQWAPDDPLLHECRSRVFDRVRERAHFGHLRHTRHFGALSLYYISRHELEPLLAHLLRYRWYLSSISFQSPSLRSCSQDAPPEYRDNIF